MASTDHTKMTATQMREVMRQLQNLQAQRNAFLQSLNPTPRSPRHGRNRIPSPPTYGDPAQRAGARNAGVDPGAQDKSGWAIYHTGYYTGSTAAYLGADPVEPPKAIPYAGVTVGEIVGYRTWWVTRIPSGRPCIDGKPNYRPRLQSLASTYLWHPGKIVQGDTGKVVKTYLDLNLEPKQIWGGVYAFRSPELDENTRSNITAIQTGLGDGFVLAIGTCTLWGDVVEHEHGYRASHARLRSIDAVYGAADLAELRREYGLEAQQ